MIKKKILFILVLCLILIVPIVSAETLTGTVGGSVSLFQNYISTTGGGGTSGGDGSVLLVKDIEYSTVTQNIIFWPGTLQTFCSGAPKNGNTATFLARRGSNSGPIVATGTIGYMRYYNLIGTEQLGYVWWSFNDWQQANLTTGNQYLYLTGYNYTQFGICNFGQATTGGGDPFLSGEMYQEAATAVSGGNLGYHGTGSYARASTETIYSSYSLTKPAGLGVSGTITKRVGGVTYPSKMYVYNGTTSAVITSDNTVTITDLIVNTVAPTLKISMISPLGTIYNSSVLFSSPVPVTPIPTPVTYDTLGLTATPNTISLGQAVSLTGTSSNATRLTYAGGLRRVVFMVNKHAQAYPFDFNEIGMFENVNATYWKFRSSYSSTWGAPSTTSPLTMTNIPDTNGLYTYAFIGYETIAGGSGAIAQAGTADVTVNGGSGAGSLTMNLFAYDGSNTNHLSNYQMNITDDNSGVVTELGNISYDINRNLPRGNSYTLWASKENYETGSKTFIVPITGDIEAGDFGAMIGVPLFPTGTLSAGNTTVTVHVTDIETYYPIGNVQIQMSVDGSSKYTGSSGESAYWILPQNTAYTVKAIKSGYCTVTESKNTGTNTYQYVPLFMKYGTCTGTTPTPTPTPIPSVTVTPIGNWTGNEGEAIVCGHLPTDATMIEVLKNGLACNGLEDKASQNLGIACLIILFCAIVLGRIAKGVGVLSGVVAGTVLATVAGFLPFWIIIVVVIMAGLIFAAKVFWSPGG